MLLRTLVIIYNNVLFDFRSNIIFYLILFDLQYSDLCLYLIRDPSRMEYTSEQQGTKRPHSSDTNDSDNPDKFTTVQYRRSKIPVKPNLETTPRNNQRKDKRPKANKPPEKAIRT